MAQDRTRVRKVVEDPQVTDDELRIIASLRGSPYHKPISKVLTLLRNQESARLLDPATPHDLTQFTRGRLSMLSDVVLLLEEEAQARYDERRKVAEHKPSE